MIIGIESTAHTFGIGVVDNGKVLANVKDSYTTEKGGIIPTDAALHHRKVADEVLAKALVEAGIGLGDIRAVAFSQGPGLAPCLKEGRDFAKKLALELGVVIVPVNHCIAHLEIGKITGALDPILLYTSGANTQIIAYAGGRYRIFGETLDIGVGNFIDTFARHVGLGFPGGPKIAELAEKLGEENFIDKSHPPQHPDRPPHNSKSSKSLKFLNIKNEFENKRYIELPYSIKGMDVSFSGMQTKLKQLYDKGEKLGDLSFSLQETAFAMLVEASERAMAHLGKKELVIGGGVGCNKRLQEMCKIMCKERNAKFFAPPNEFLVDNGGMIAYLGEIMFDKNIFVKGKDIGKIDFDHRQRTDSVEVVWK